MLCYCCRLRVGIGPTDKQRGAKMNKIIITIMIMLSMAELAEASSQIVYETIAYEASGEGMEGMVAVANVIKTRTIKRKKTAEQIVLAKAQFSCWKDGKPTQKRVLKQADIDKAKAAWEKAIVWEYDHYATTKIDNYWTKKAKKKMVINNHIFYEL